MNHLIVPKVPAETLSWRLNREHLFLICDGVSAPRALNETMAREEQIVAARSYVLIFSRINLTPERIAAATLLLGKLLDAGSCTIWFHRKHGAAFVDADIDKIATEEGAGWFDTGWVKNGKAMIQNYSVGARETSPASAMIQQFKLNLAADIDDPAAAYKSAFAILDEAAGIQDKERVGANAFEVLERLFPLYVQDPDGRNIAPSDMDDLVAVLSEAVGMKDIPSGFRPRFEALAENVTQRLSLSSKLLKPIPEDGNL